MSYSPKAFQILTVGTSQIGKFISTHGTTGDVIIPDDDKFSFGTGSDASIYFDATNLVIADENIPVQIGHASNTVTIAGNLTINGTTTTVNSTTLLIDDKLIELAHSPSGSEGDDAAINGGGIILKSSDSDKSIVWTDATDSWDFNQGGIFAGILKTDDTTDATSKTDGSLQTDGGLSVAKAIYNGTAATFAADSGIVTIGSSTAATFSAAGLLNINNATDATSTTDGSLQTDGGLSVAKDCIFGNDVKLLTDASVFSMGVDSDFTITHDNSTGATIATGATGLAISTPAVTVSSSAASSPILHITNTHAGATSGELRFNKDSASGDDSDVMGLISFYGTDAGEATHERLAYVDAIITDSAAGSEAASLRFYVAENDANLTAGLVIAGQADSDGEVDVTIGAGAASTTTVAGDFTVNGGDILVAGGTPKITIGDAGAEDAMLAFDGNAQDFHIALDDTADDLVIGVGTAAGTTTAIAINEDAQVSIVDLFAANVAGTFGTFADGDATPSVATGNLWKHHASTQSITMFDGGVAGQTIHVISTAAITYDVTSTNLKGGSADIVTASGDITSWFFDGTNWYLVQFMDVSADMSSVGGGGGGSTAADDITAGDAAVSIATTVGNITLDAQATNADIIFKVDDADASITALTLDGSDDGAAIFKSTIKGTVFKPAVEVISSANVTVSNGYTAITTAGSNRTATMPEATAALVGSTYTVKKVDSGSGNISVTAEGDGLIDGGASVVLYHQFESVTVICRAADVWDIV